VYVDFLGTRLFTVPEDEGEAAMQLEQKLNTATLASRTIRNWPQVLTLYAMAKAHLFSGDLRFNFRDGTKMTVPAAPNACAPIFEVMVTDDYHLDQLREQSIKYPDLIMDVGAHVGATTISLGRLFPHARLACYEPNPGTVRYLRANLALNHITAEVIEAAVDGESGLATLGGKTGSCTTALSPSSTSDTTEVALVSFHEELRRLQNGGSVLVKMDCEGTEYSILDASSQADWTPVDVLLLEYHPMVGRGGGTR
jgi:FkbM family methyltransferase